MGRRGPKAGTKYRKRVWIAPAVEIGSDRELVAAQRFNERLINWAFELERREGFPINALQSDLVERMLEVLGAMQGSVTEGIADYIFRDE
jgi:hypothetical protein